MNPELTVDVSRSDGEPMHGRAGVRTISVVIPTHNRRGCLEHALASVFAQTRPADEVIVVDDGSTDGTVAWMSTIARRHARLRCIPQERRGAGAARNRGIAVATGEWIAFLDSDDRWEREKLAHAAALVQKDRTIEFIHSNVRSIHPDGPEKTRIRPPRDLVDRSFLLSSFLIKSSSVMLKRDLLDRIGDGFPEDLRTCEDFHVWWRAVMMARGIGYVASPDVVCHLAPASLTRSASQAALLRDNIEARGRIRRWTSACGLPEEYGSILRRDEYWDWRELARISLGAARPVELLGDLAACARGLSYREAARALASSALAVARNAWQKPDRP